MPSCDESENGSETRATIAVIGVNHRETPIALRERLSVAPAELGPMLARVRSVEGVREAAILSTCNRVELYACLRATHRQAAAGADALQRAARALLRARGVGLEEVGSSLYRMEGPGAVRHLFEVACGLDSMVPGENEVFGQVKDAYLAAVEAGAVGTDLSRLFQKAFKVAKDVRSRTGISRRNVSVATVVAELARKVFGPLAGAKVSLVGAGEVAELVLKTLVSGGARAGVVANRSIESARALASRYGGEAAGLGGVEAALTRADILVASTAAPEPVVTADHVRAAARARRGRPVLIVDLGVPRNVEEDAARVEGVILYDIDALQDVVARNRAYRLEEADRARALIAEEVRKFAALVRTDDVAGTIARLCSEMKLIGDFERRRALARMGDLTDLQREEVGRMAERIVGKMLHSPIRALKEEARSARGAEAERMLRRLFGL